MPILTIPIQHRTGYHTEKLWKKDKLKEFKLEWRIKTVSVTDDTLNRENPMHCTKNLLEIMNSVQLQDENQHTKSVASLYINNELSEKEI